MANAEYGSASGVDRHHEPVHRLLGQRATLRRYCHEGLSFPHKSGGRLRTASSRPCSDPVYVRFET
jgi:hypothetical protein